MSAPVPNTVQIHNCDGHLKTKFAELRGEAVIQALTWPWGVAGKNRITGMVET